MKKLILPALFAMIGLWACNDKAATCDVVGATAPADQVASLKHFLDSAGIEYVADPRGFFYNISDSGSATHPTACNTIIVDYTGKLTNGNQFDAGHGITLSLLNVINGWREGLPLVGENGHINLYIPPALGYGSTATASIPANSNLIFAIDLVKIKS